MQSWYVFLSSTALAVIPNLMAYGQLSDSESLPKRIDISRQFVERKLEFLDLTWEAWRARIPKRDDHIERLELNSERVDFLEAVESELSLDDKDIQELKKSGLVLVDPHLSQSFPAAYYNLYTRDLPVLITCDSILHAFHHSYDKVLLELESNYLRTSLESLLGTAHMALENVVGDVRSQELRDTFRDVDLYLTVARSLLAATSSKEDAFVPSKMDQDDSVQRILERINFPESAGVQRIWLYGGEREIDFTQFKVRGHYSKSSELSSYFRCMTWLGRPDCGWNLFASGTATSNDTVETRELRDAALLVHLLQSADVAQEYAALENVLQSLVGDPDNLTVGQLWSMLDAAEIRTAQDLLNESKIAKIQASLLEQSSGAQTIRSQIVRQPSGASISEQLPQVFQLFGQRFTIDSFILANVVHDSIVFNGRQVPRSMPTGLDAMAGLGNDFAVGLLEDELRRWNYSANLAALQQVVRDLPAEYWHENVYTGWISALRDLNADLTPHSTLPQVFRTEAWRKKQLQTQLASWSELRHDTVLYAKASYSAPSCEFPVAYVEPYPNFFATLEQVALRSARTLRDIAPPKPSHRRFWGSPPQTQQSYADFFSRMATHFAKLSEIARKEISKQPFTEDERLFLQRTISQKGSRVFGGSGFANITIYDGWYTELLYGFDTDEQKKWRATIADVHTDVQHQKVLQVGVGPVNYCVILADDGPCNKVFVGPVFSYYEFNQPMSDRLTDDRWQSMLKTSQAPARPNFIQSLVGGASARMSPVVTTLREDGQLYVFDGEPPLNAWSRKRAPQFSIDREGLGKLASQWPKVRHLDLSETSLADEDLDALSSLGQLRALNLSGTEIKGAGLAYLSDSRQLRGLNLSNTQIEDDSLSFIENWVYLEELNLSDTSITDQGLSFLSHNRYLRKLNLTGTLVTEAAVDKLRLALKDCLIVRTEAAEK